MICRGTEAGVKGHDRVAAALPPLTPVRPRLSSGHLGNVKLLPLCVIHADTGKLNRDRSEVSYSAPRAYSYNAHGETPFALNCEALISTPVRL